jgi:site-specific DNA-cytosine methylase
MRINGLDLFSGIGGIALALHPWVQTVAYCEIEKYPQKVLLKNMENGNLDPAPIYPDVTTLKGEDLEHPIDIITGGFPCFGAGTLILTSRGHIPIEDVVVGDEVLTHLGRWMPVVQTMSRQADSYYEVKGLGILPTKTTSEHPYYVSKTTRVWDSEGRKYTRAFHKTHWKTVGEMANAGKQERFYATQVIPEPDPYTVSSIGFSDPLLELAGYYVANGWRVERKGRLCGRVVIACPNAKLTYLTHLLTKCGLTFCISPEKGCVKVTITVGWLYTLLECFGKYAHGKKIPKFLYSASEHQARLFLNGYIAGDGCQYENQVSVTTVSEDLALGVALMFQVGYGKVARIYKTENEDRRVILGRDCKQRDVYQVIIPHDPKLSYVEGRYGHKQIKKIVPIDEPLKVYNIGVSQDESYIANGAIVHNCQDISVAGHGAGLAGERSGLFFEIVRLARELRPTFIFLENVPAITTRGGCAVVAELTKIGYECRWTTLSAKAVGANHKRERWWLLARLQPSHARREPTRPYEGIRPESIESGLQDLTEFCSQLPNPHGSDGRVQPESPKRQATTNASGNGSPKSMADARSAGRKELNATAEPDREGYSARCLDSIWRKDWWTVEPDVGRIFSNGIPFKLDEDKLNEAMQTLWHDVGAQAVWKEARRYEYFQKASLLRPFMYGEGVHEGFTYTRCNTKTCSQVSKRLLQLLQVTRESSHTSHRWRLDEQSYRKFDDALLVMSYIFTSQTGRLGKEEVETALQYLWSAVLSVESMLDTSHTIQEAWESLDCSWRDSLFLSPWNVEPPIPRVAHGIPSRVDRVKALGNSVVPLQARVAFEYLLKGTTP